MNKEHIDIYFYKPATLPRNPKHKISFDDIDDIHNPFSKHNLILKTSIEKNKCLDFANFIYEMLVLNDLHKHDDDAFLKKAIP